MNVFGLKRFLILSTVILVCFTSFRSLRHQDPGSAPIRIGIFLPLSGPTSSFGLATLNGIRLAADETNKAGGINNRQIQLISEDDQGRPENAAAAVTKLIEQDHVVALLGDVASANSLAAARRAQAAMVPMISPASTNPAVTEVGNYIFRTAFSDPFQAGVLAEFAAKGLKAKRVAVFVDNTSDYSQSLAKNFTENVSRLGGQVLMRQGYVAGDRDFKAQLAAIKSSKPDVIVVCGYYTEAGMIAKQAKELRINTPLLGGDGWDSAQLWKFGGAALNGSYMVNHYASDDPSPANKEFVAGYKARYEGLEPDALAALGYDAMKMLADAIKRAGTTEGSVLQQALARTKDFEGVTGLISIDKNRATIKPAVILKLQDGKFVYYATIQPTQAKDLAPGKHPISPPVIGTWHGESICVGDHPACKDEDVVYRFEPVAGKPGVVTLLADKIIDGKREPMGKLEFQYDEAKGTLSSEFTRGHTHGLWEFQLTGDKMEGTLVVFPDMSVARRVKVSRVSEDQVPAAPGRELYE